jgi:hypothetical protein
MVEFVIRDVNPSSTIADISAVRKMMDPSTLCLREHMYRVSK